MNRHALLSLLALLLCCSTSLPAQKAKTYIPWKNGKLVVSEEGRYLKHENGVPFFWLGETGWLMPQRLNRDEVSYYLNKCKDAGYNMVQVQVLNGVPSMNIYGQYSMTDGFNFKDINRKGIYGYWDHMDYIIKSAASRGIYIGMVCIWGTPVEQGLMNEKEAVAYGKFLAERYKDEPNIIWMIGGDIRGDNKTEVWDALANSIRSIDKGHLMTFHPRGRTTSATWFNDREWLDFNMFQSGHRRYGQRNGDGDYPIEENTEEDNWRFVEASQAKTPLKPVIDDEPIYEDIPQGLHDPNETRWNQHDVRRYAYWSVFAGSFGHSYGHNDIMQFIWGKLLGRHKILPKVSPNKTWEGFLGGVISTTVIGYFLGFLTPLSAPNVILVSALVAIAGFSGDVVISAIKRDKGIKDMGNSIPGHGGVFDRIDSLAYTAPVFFHLVYYIAY